MKTDPILLEILNNSLVAVADQSAATLSRAAYTAYVKLTQDFMFLLATPDGEPFAHQMAYGQLGRSGPFRTYIERCGKIREGDIFVSNDPYETKGEITHLPDICLVKPIFWEDKLVCFACSWAHSSDIGGSVPGSTSNHNYEIYQEGLRIPPVKLIDGGKLVEAVAQIIKLNVRNPRDSWGDIQAQIAALNVAKEGMHDIITKHGVKVVTQAQYDLMDWAEVRARAIIRNLPDGIFEFDEFLDDDGITEVPVCISVKIIKRKDEMIIDLTGTDDQLQSALNCPSFNKEGNMVIDNIVRYITTKDSTIPKNAGLRRPIKTIIPEGCFLNPHFPAACANRSATLPRVWDALAGALKKMVEEVPSGGGGLHSIIVWDEPFSNRNVEGRKLLMLQNLQGSTGGRYNKDGLDLGNIIGGTRNINPLEYLESEASIYTKKLHIIQDSGGPGKFRGGCGLLWEFEVTTHEVKAAFRGQSKYRFEPFGWKGGKAGTLGKIILNPGTRKEKKLSGVSIFDLFNGDVVRMETMGGGGYGDPLDRQPTRVLHDVQQGYVSTDSAERDYGVILDGDKVDDERTKKLRSILNRRLGPNQDIDRGIKRKEIDKFWGNRHRSIVKQFLLTFPPSLRHMQRVKIFRELAETSKKGQVTEAMVRDICNSKMARMS